MTVAGAAFVGAAVSAQMAWLHARAVEAAGLICGGAVPHCAWCPTGLALAATGLAALAWEHHAGREAARPTASPRVQPASWPRDR